MTRIRGIDWGAYLAWNGAIMLPWKQLIEKANVQFFVVKGCQEDVPNGYSSLLNLKAARDAGVPINGSYYWSFGYGSAQYYIDLYSKSIDSENPDFIMIDIEQFSDGNGVKIPQQALSDYNQKLCEGIAARYPEKRVGIYTRRNFVSDFSLPMNNWLPKFDGGWVASWPDYGLDVYNFTWEQIVTNKMKRNLDVTWTRKDLWDIIDISGWEPSNMQAWKTWNIWQYSSRMKYPTLGWPYDSQTDWCVFNGSLDDMKNWVNKKEIVPTMASIYNTNVPQESRARLIQLDALSKTADAVAISKDVPAVVLKMGGMDGIKGSGKELYQESGFDIRVKQFNDLNTPVIALFNLDAGYWLWKQMNQGPVENMTPQDNPIIKQLQYQLSLGKVNALMLDIGIDVTHLGVAIPDTWQKSVLLNVLDKVLAMQDGGTFPKMPIIVQTDPWFIIGYPNEFSTYLNGKRNQVYVSLKDITGFPATAGPHVNSLKLAFDTWFPPNTFKYYGMPYGFYADKDGNKDRIVLHMYSTRRYFVDGLMVGQDGKTVPLDMFLWSDTKEEMFKLLGAGAIGPPPVEPPVDPLLEARVKVLEDKVVVMQSEIDGLKGQKDMVISLEQSVGKLQANEEWMKKFILDVIALYTK